MAQASAEKLKHTGPAEKERLASVSQREQLAITPPFPKGKSRPCQKEKEQSRLSRVPDHEGERVKVGEREGDQNESMERKGWTTR